MYLLDTNVISAGRVPHREPQVAAWLAATPAPDVFTASIVVGEIEQGVRVKERDDPAQGRILRQWFNKHIIGRLGETGKVLPYDLRAARIYGSYRVPEHAPANDAMIAAVAQANGLVVATRNVKHFESLGIAVMNPWLTGGHE